ncbi:MAG: imidazole glycerol phosphate synthase subunit HisH [Lachnospiraceae bacterium]|nr:imidazole glycerol phosphate synthase subunit HisH [Lachnospiraceae bacterium]
MIAIIDYDAGNLRSVEKALNYIGESAVVTRDASEILRADKVILPGVGAFGDAMGKIRGFNLEDVIKQVVANETPFLGICLGLQLMFASSEEGPGVKGLDILPGKIVRIPAGEGLKIPHIGWNDIEINPKSRLFKGLDNNSYVYFVHSYYLQAERAEDVAATTQYGVKIHAAAERGNVFATQFHPEKSGEVGLQILRNFANI